MSSADVLDDYLGELLLQTVPATAAPPPEAPAAEAERAVAPAAAEDVLASEHVQTTAPGHTAAEDVAPQSVADEPHPDVKPAVAGADGDQAPVSPTFEAPAPAPVLTVAPAAEPVVYPPSPTPPTPPAAPAADIAPATATPPSAPAPVRTPPPVPAPMPAPIARTPSAPVSANSAWQQLQQHARDRQVEQNSRHGRSEPVSRWLRLRCGQQTYALELLKVQEVVLPVPLLALRGTAHSMLGIMNLRGQVVPVIDLGLHLGAGAIEDDPLTRIVVLEENGDTLGLRVSAVEDVASLAESQIEPPDTARICQISNDLFRGVARLSHQPMILLDASRLLR